MPNLDDELRRRMQRAGRRVGTDGVEGRLHQRRAHKQITQKAGRGVLAVAVLAGSAFGVAGLNRAFRGDGVGGEPGTGSGTIGFVRLFDTCGGLDAAAAADLWFEIVTVDVATGEQRIVPIHVDYPGEGRRAPAPQAPEFSPDGTQVAWRDRINEGLYLSDVASGATTSLAVGQPVTGDPHWSPDGSLILFSGEDTARGHSLGAPLPYEGAIYTVGSDGSDVQRLTDGAVGIWTDDGRIAFLRQSGPARITYFTMNADGSDVTNRYESPDDVPVLGADWSPVGTSVAASATLRGNTDVFAVDLTLRTASRLTDDPAQDSSPSWSPDGSEIAFQTGRWGTPLESVSPQQLARGHSEIALMNADGSNVRRLTNDCWDDFFPTWIPDDSVVRSLPVWEPPAAGATSPFTMEGIDGPVCDVRSAKLALGSATGSVTTFGRPDGDLCDGTSTFEMAVAPEIDPIVNSTTEVRGCTPATCDLLGTPDLGSDGVREVAVIQRVEDGSTSGTILLFVPTRVADGSWRLDPVSVGGPRLPSTYDPGAASFLWGATSARLGGVDCGFDDPMGVGLEGGFVAWIADQNGDGTYRLREDLFAWDGHQLTYIDYAGSESVGLEDLRGHGERFCRTGVLPPRAP